MANESPRKVSEWVKFCPSFQNSLESGDLVEVNQGPFSHWTMYYKDGLVIDFDPAEKRDENYEEEPFRPGAVRSTQLKEVAGDFDIRVNNMPEYERTVRPIEDSIKLMEILPNAPGLRYSGTRFNCGIFTTYLKFQGDSDQDQINLIEAINLGTLHIRNHFQDANAKDAFFKQLGYLQWWENSNKTLKNEIPRRLFEQEIQVWGDNK